MMRWNSTKTYTEEDMIRMQQEAINRVHEFQARSQAATQQFIDVPPSAMQPVTEEPEPILFDPTPEISFSQGQAMGGPAQITEGGVIEAESHVVPQQPAQQAQQPTDPISGLIDKLGIDTETLLILGLLFLLYGLYRGLERAQMSILLTVVSLGVRVALAYALAPIPRIGLQGIWWAIPIGWLLADLAGFLWYGLRRERLLSPLARPEQ